MSDVCICLNVFTYVSVEAGKEHKSLRAGATNFIELPNLCVGVKLCSLWLSNNLCISPSLFLIFFYLLKLKCNCIPPPLLNHPSNHLVCFSSHVLFVKVMVHGIFFFKCCGHRTSFNTCQRFCYVVFYFNLVLGKFLKFSRFVLWPIHYSTISCLIYIDLCAY